eukprot:scaffold74323_cov20-Tisochrysis_lutea.AAC.1
MCAARVAQGHRCVSACLSCPKPFTKCVSGCVCPVRGTMRAANYTHLPHALPRSQRLCKGLHSAATPCCPQAKHIYHMLSRATDACEDVIRCMQAVPSDLYRFQPCKHHIAMEIRPEDKDDPHPALVTAALQ